MEEDGARGSHRHAPAFTPARSSTPAVARDGLSAHALDGAAAPRVRAPHLGHDEPAALRPHPPRPPRGAGARGGRAHGRRSASRRCNDNYLLNKLALTAQQKAAAARRRRRRRSAGRSRSGARCCARCARRTRRRRHRCTEVLDYELTHGGALLEPSPGYWGPRLPGGYLRTVPSAALIRHFAAHAPQLAAAAAGGGGRRRLGVVFGVDNLGGMASWERPAQMLAQADVVLVARAAALSCRRRPVRPPRRHSAPRHPRRRPGFCAQERRRRRRAAALWARARPLCQRRRRRRLGALPAAASGRRRRAPLVHQAARRARQRRRRRRRDARRARVCVAGGARRAARRQRWCRRARGARGRGEGRGEWEAGSAGIIMSHQHTSRHAPPPLERLSRSVQPNAPGDVLPARRTLVERLRANGAHAVAARVERHVLFLVHAHRATASPRRASRRRPAECGRPRRAPRPAARRARRRRLAARAREPRRRPAGRCFSSPDQRRVDRARHVRLAPSSSPTARASARPSSTGSPIFTLVSTTTPGIGAPTSPGTSAALARTTLPAARCGR